MAVHTDTLTGYGASHELADEANWALGTFASPPYGSPAGYLVDAGGAYKTTADDGVKYLVFDQALGTDIFVQAVCDFDVHSGGDNRIGVCIGKKGAYEYITANWYWIGSRFKRYDADSFDGGDVFAGNSGAIATSNVSIKIALLFRGGEWYMFEDGVLYKSTDAVAFGAPVDGTYTSPTGHDPTHAGLYFTGGAGAANYRFRDFVCGDGADAAAFDPALNFADYAGGGALAVDLPTIAASSTLAAPTVTAQAATVTLPAIATGATLAAPTVTAQAANLALPTIAASSTLAAPTVTAQAATVTLPAIGSTSTLAAPTISASGATVALPTITASSTLATPTVTPQAAAVTLPAIASTSSTSAPAIAAAGVLVLPAIASTSVPYAPGVSAVAASVTLPTIASTAALSAVTVEAQAVFAMLPHIASVAVISSPRIYDQSGAPVLTGGSLTVTWADVDRTTNWTDIDRSLTWSGAT